MSEFYEINFTSAKLFFGVFFKVIIPVLEGFLGFIRTSARYKLSIRYMTIITYCYYFLRITAASTVKTPE